MPYEIGKGWVPDQSTDSWNMMKEAGIDQPTTNNIFSRPAGTSPTGNTDPSNPAVNQGAAKAVDTVAQVGSSIIQGVSQYNQTEQARQEARDIANQNRTDTLKQQAVSNAQQTRAIELEEKQLALKKRKDNFNVKLSSFIQQVTDDVNNRQNFINGADTMFGDMLKNEQTKNMIVQFAGGKV